jgi:acyl carrier protein
MDNTEERLIKIFEAVFPGLTKEQIRAASQDAVSNWDSIAAVTLINLMDEEFGVTIDFERVADLTSFSEILGYMKEMVGSSA